MKKYIYIIFIAFSDLTFSQQLEYQDSNHRNWNIYGGIQSVDIFDKNHNVEEDGYSVKRLDEFYFGFFKNTDLTIGSLPIKVGIEMSHLGTASQEKAYEFPLNTNQLGLHRINDVDIIINNLNVYALAKWNVSDRFYLELGPSYGIKLDAEATVYYTDLQGYDHKITAPLDEYDQNDFGIMLGAGYLLNKRTFINFGIYHGLEDHAPGRFNSLYLGLGLSF